MYVVLNNAVIGRNSNTFEMAEDSVLSPYDIFERVRRFLFRNICDNGHFCEISDLNIAPRKFLKSSYAKFRYRVTGVESDNVLMLVGGHVSLRRKPKSFHGDSIDQKAD